MPKIKRINHIGIAVNKVEAALRFWCDSLGLELAHEEEVTSDQVRTYFLPVGESSVELLEATGEGSPVAKFLQKRGEGIHHLCLEVEDLPGILAQLKQKGIPLLDEKPRKGAENCLIAFIHPKATGGILLELSENSTRRSYLDRFGG